MVGRNRISRPLVPRFRCRSPLLRCNSPMLSRRKPPCNLAKRRFQPNIQRIGLTALALFVVWGATVGTLYLADAIFGFGLLFLVVTSVVCTAIALTMDRWFGSVRW